jgi:hypothetical protein
VAWSELDSLRRRAAKTGRWFEETVADGSADEANWWPPGTANSIGATYLHVAINTDVELNQLVHLRAPLVDAEWAGDVGQGYPYDPDRFDSWVRHAPVDMTRAGLGVWEGRDLYELHGCDHPRIHGGEIAVLKGLQGGVGRIEPDEFRAAVTVEVVDG